MAMNVDRGDALRFPSFRRDCEGWENRQQYLFGRLPSFLLPSAFWAADFSFSRAGAAACFAAGGGVDAGFRFLALAWLAALLVCRLRMSGPVARVERAARRG